jgi:hypothetical protein
VARILLNLGVGHPPPGRYLSEGWDKVLQPAWTVVSNGTSPLAWFAAIVLAGYAVVIWQRAIRFSTREQTVREGEAPAEPA